LREFQGLEPKNRETGWKIRINRDGVDESTSKERSLAELAAVSAIPELLGKASYARPSNYEKGDKTLSERGLKGYHRFFAPMITNGNRYVVLMLVKENETGSKSFYLHKMEVVDSAGIFTEDESPVTQRQDQGDSPTLPLNDTESTIANIADWLRNVKHSGTSDGTFDQSDGQGSKKRGAVTLYPADVEHRQANVIRVMKGGDLSTILHELGHIFFHDMQEFVLSGKAPDSVVRDYARLRQAIGNLKIPAGMDRNSDEAKQIVVLLAEIFD
jgi:hypothetical protein